MFQRIQDQTPPEAPVLLWLDTELGRRGLSSQEIIRLEHQKQAALNVSVRNIITSMRLVLELDWKEFFEASSQVESILRSSPGYRDMDFESRDLYRHAIENLARGSGVQETEVAARAVKAVAKPGSGFHGRGRFPSDRIGPHGLRERNSGTARVTANPWDASSSGTGCGSIPAPSPLSPPFSPSKVRSRWPIAVWASRR